MRLNETKRRVGLGIVSYHVTYNLSYLPDAHPHSLNSQCLLTLFSSAAFDCLIYIALFMKSLYTRMK